MATTTYARTFDDWTQLEDWAYDAGMFPDEEPAPCVGGRHRIWMYEYGQTIVEVWQQQREVMCKGAHDSVLVLCREYVVWAQIPTIWGTTTTTVALDGTSYKEAMENAREYAKAR